MTGCALLLGAVDPVTAREVADLSVDVSASAGWIVRIVITVCAAMTLVLGPGFCLRRWWPLDIAFVWIPGVLGLVCIGVLAWVLPFEPRHTALVLVALLLALMWVGTIGDTLVAHDERAVVLLLVLLVMVGVGRATWSQGPVHELYGGTVSRNLEAEIRSDPRIQYGVVKLVTRQQAPYSKRSRDFYAPYTFYDRGPIAGLAATPVVLTSGAVASKGLPDEPWEPFDAQGFAAYRIVLMVLAATIVFSTFGLVRSFLQARRAIGCTVLVGASPFVVHEVYFTWPKLLAASFGIAGFVALTRRRALVAGLLVGLGYVAHPAALFVLPALIFGWGALLWRGFALANVHPAQRWFVVWLRGTSWCVGGVLVVYGVWAGINAGHLVDNFSSYVYAAGGRTNVPFHVWINSRLDSVANTFIPFRMYATERADPWLNAAGARSPEVIRFAYSYVNTWPFAVGLVYFPLFVYGVVECFRRVWALCVGVLAIPLFVFTVYWGATTNGMAREGLHAIVVLSLVAAFVGHSVLTTWSARAVRLVATARVGEVVLVVMVPTLATAGVLGRGLFQPTDVFALGLMLSGIAGLAAMTWWSLSSAGATSAAPAPTCITGGASQGDVGSGPRFG